MRAATGLDARIAKGNRGDRPAIRNVQLRAAAILLLTGGCVVSVAIGRSSPIRVVLSLSFLLFGPGLALAELLEINDLAQRIVIATAASLALETLIAVALVYGRAFSTQLAIGILAAFTVSVLGMAVLRARRIRVEHGDGYAADT